MMMVFSNDFSFIFKSTHLNWQCHDTLLMQEHAGVEEGNVFNQGAQEIMHNGRSTFTHVATSRPRQTRTERTGAFKDRITRDERTGAFHINNHTREKLGHRIHGEQKHNKKIQGCDITPPRRHVPRHNNTPREGGSGQTGSREAMKEGGTRQETGGSWNRRTLAGPRPQP